jgi:hypothetical protein
LVFDGAHGKHERIQNPRCQGTWNFAANKLLIEARKQATG